MSLNLRTHRKILVADGRVGFTGGHEHPGGPLPERAPRDPVQDIHFRVRGPVVAQLQEAFADDWLFTTGEVVAGRGVVSATGTGRSGAGARHCWTGRTRILRSCAGRSLAALNIARRSVRIVTPYFLPDTAIGVGAESGGDAGGAGGYRSAGA